MDGEKEELKRQVEELTAKLEERERQAGGIDDQVALMEKSYELAAKYMGQNGKDGAAVQNDNLSLIHIFLFTAACILAAVGAMAQGNGQAGITEATQMVTSYFEPGTKLIYAIGAVVGLIGGVKVYGKFSSGDPDTSKTAASWFGACIFLIVAATILRSFFL